MRQGIQSKGSEKNYGLRNMIDHFGKVCSAEGTLLLHWHPAFPAITAASVIARWSQNLISHLVAQTASSRHSHYRFWIRFLNYVLKQLTITLLILNDYHICITLRVTNYLYLLFFFLVLGCLVYLLSLFDRLALFRV